MKLTEGEFKNPLQNQLLQSKDVFEIFRSIKDEANETSLVIYLTEDLSGIYDVHSTGFPFATSISVSDLIGRAYLLRSRYFIVVHNHPGWQFRNPARRDMKVLKELQLYAYPLPTLSMLDFLIIGDGNYWSWFDEQDGGNYEQGALGGDQSGT